MLHVHDSLNLHNDVDEIGHIVFYILIFQMRKVRHKEVMTQDTSVEKEF